MAQLDPYLALLAAGHGDTLLFIDGELATLARDGASRPVTKQPIGAAQLQTLLREIAPAEAHAGLAAGPTSFRYDSGDVAYLVRTGERDGRFQLSIALEARVAAAGMTPAAGVAAVAPPPPATPATASPAAPAPSAPSAPSAPPAPPAQAAAPRRVTVEAPVVVSEAQVEAAKGEIDA